MDLEPTLLNKIAKESGTSPRQAAATVDLLEEQATVPFIARYRKEITGNLDESKIRRIAECYRDYNVLLERRRSMMAKIKGQGKLTEELKSKLLTCYDKSRLEDLYLPFKPKRSADAAAAKEQGLEALAKHLWEQVPGESILADTAESYISVDKKVETREAAIQGALTIVAEWMVQDAGIRDALRQLMLSEGIVVSKVVEGKEGENTKYEGYYDFREDLSRIPFHRITALRRGVKERILTFNIEIDDDKALQLIRERVIREADSQYAPHLEQAIKDSYFNSLKPILQAEIRSYLKERTDTECLKLFQTNLANLLLAPPVGPIPVMGIDPGPRSACKIAVIDEKGGYREHATVYPTLPRNHSDRAEAILYRLIQRHKTRAIAIGNGVGSRETDRFVKSFLAKYHSGHPFDLSLVRGKKAKVSSPSKEAGKTNGQAVENQPTGDDSTIARDKESPVVTLAPEQDLPKETSPSEAGEEKNTAGLEQVQQKPGPNLHPENLEALPLAQADPTSTGAVASAENKPSSTQLHAENEIAAAAVPIETSPPAAAEPAPTEMTSGEGPPGTEQPERQPVFTAIVHKGGTAAYANSEAARKEFPKLDLGVRGAVSIARRLQDPLVELAKIQPKSIGVGQYQQDVEQRRLKQKLEGTLESCINRVGVDVNTATIELLGHVAGLNSPLAENLVAFREQHGPFSSRSQLRQVPGFTDKTFEQAAGFLRVSGGDQPLDRTAIHPERYRLVEEMAQSVKVTVDELFENPAKLAELDLEKLVNDRVSLPTLQGIKRELTHPGRDPRKAFVPPSFRDDVKELSDLQKGMLVEGTVSNVTRFGAFVDIGVQQDGLIHISELSSHFVQDPTQAVHVGQVVKAKVIGVDTDSKRISLSIKALQAKSNSGRRKKNKPEKTPQRPPSPERETAPLKASSNVREKLGTNKSGQKPLPKKRHRRQGKKHRATGVETAVLRRSRSTTPEVEDLPDTSNLSFSEKIRLLQEKFGGLR